jgi:hypothetical protein
MSYGLRYTSSFDSIAGLTHTTEIYKKDYSGSSDSFVLAGTPVVQEWQADDPKQPIAGCQLIVRIINSGSLPASDFFSNEDDTFLVKQYEGSNLVFTGYLIQDECSEVLLDPAHEIVLKFTDNLALLKDITLDAAAKLWGTEQTYTRLMTGVNLGGTGILSVDGGSFEIPIGTVFTLTGTDGDGTYTVENTIFSGGVFTIFVAGELSDEFTNQTGDIEFILPIDLTDIKPLSELFWLCLKSTFLNLDTKVSTSLIPDGATTNRLIEEVFLRTEDFLSSNKWDSCYTVLEKILKRFNACLFQSDGIWHIVRWDELRTTDNTIVSYLYDSEFVYDSSGSLSTVMNYGNGSDIETGAIQFVERNFKYVKETFNYDLPTVLIRNLDLSVLGNLRTSYADGSNTIYEYEMPYWYDPPAPAAPYPDRYIRIVKDENNFELERYCIIVGPSGASTECALSDFVEVSAGDVIKVSMEYRTAASYTSNTTTNFHFELYDGTNTRRVTANGIWKNPATDINVFLAHQTIFSGDDTADWHTVSVVSDQVPFSGKFYVYLSQITRFPPNNETHFKNMRVDIINNLNGTTKVIGHTHTRTQDVSTKNQLDNDINFDDAPRSTIKGTFFLSSTTGVLRDRTTVWKRYPTDPNPLALGKLTTFENLFWRKQQRYKVEANLLGLKQSGNLLSKSRIIRLGLTPYSDKTFVFGRLAIDYKRDSANATLFEIWDDAEVNDTDLTSVYEFKYLYEKS